MRKIRDARIRAVQEGERHRCQRDRACGTHSAGKELQNQASKKQFLSSGSQGQERKADKPGVAPVESNCRGVEGRPLSQAADYRRADEQAACGRPHKQPRQRTGGAPQPESYRCPGCPGMERKTSQCHRKGPGEQGHRGESDRVPGVRTHQRTHHNGDGHRTSHE